MLAACRPASEVPKLDDDGRIPGEKEEQAVSIAFLKTLYKGAPVRITGEYLISGVVISNDYQGNFYKTLVVEDETGGIEIKLDLEGISRRFWVYSRVTVRCNGLWLGSYGGTLQLGTEPYDDYQTQFIPEGVAGEHIMGDNSFYGEMVPRTLEISELSTRDVSTFVAFDGVSFIAEEHGMSWAESDAETDTDRHLVSTAGDTLTVRTSRYALFAEYILPEETGRVQGVLGYFNGNYQLVVHGHKEFIPLRSERR